ncbi:MAG: hypothetical protein NTV24_02335 [Candidatus Woesebacteria bacterium]|nr:hypothetical protein [Candidatus Woesebacteria bacterium]
MTLKQFFQIAGGALIAFIIYSLPLMGIIKWPLVVISALLGIALAFLPLEERPLERWIFAFFKSVYSTTLFSWKKTEKEFNYYRDEAAAPSEKILYAGGEAKLQEYLKKSSSNSFSGNLEKIEGSFLSGITNIFTSVVPSIKVGGPPLTAPEQIPVQIPVVRNIPKLFVEETTSQAKAPGSVSTTVVPVTSGYGTVAAKQVQFSIDAAPPSPPTTPNTLTGQVIDQEKHIVEGAIMEIRDSMGRPVRALKSNKLGHFMVVTPLMSGKYEIITEKDGFSFEPLGFETTGTIIPPIAIYGNKI